MATKLETLTICSPDELTDFDITPSWEKLPDEGYNKDDLDLADPIHWYLRRINSCTILEKNDQIALAKEMAAVKDRFNYYLTQTLPEDTIALPEDFANKTTESRRTYNTNFNTLYESCLRWVAKVAQSYLGKGLSYLDLVQAGNLSLERSIEKFDYLQGCSITTYATPRIHRDIRRAIISNARSVAMSVEMFTLIPKILKAEENLWHELQREPTWREKSQAIMKQLGISPDTYQAILNVLKGPISFSTLVGKSKDTTLEEITSNKEQPVAEQGEKLWMKGQVENILEQLKPDEREFLKLRYELGGSAKMTQNELGVKFGKNLRWAQKKEKQVLKKIRAIAELRGLKEY